MWNVWSGLENNKEKGLWDYVKSVLCTNSNVCIWDMDAECKKVEFVTGSGEMKFLRNIAGNKRNNHLKMKV